MPKVGQTPSLQPIILPSEQPVQLNTGGQSVSKTSEVQTNEGFAPINRHEASQPLPTSGMQSDGLQPAPRGQSILRMQMQPEGEVSGPNRSIFNLQENLGYPVVGFDQILKQIPKTPEGQAMLKGLLSQIEGKTGIAIPLAMSEAILTNPERMNDVLQFSPANLKKGAQAINLYHHAQGTKQNTPSSSSLLPQKVDFSQLDKLDIELPEPKMKQIGPGLWQGTEKSDISAQQAKQNIVMAGVLDQLSTNQTNGSDKPFQASYNGQSYEKLDTFLDALRADGHTIEVSVGQRIADFADLKTKDPDGNIIDVAAPLFVKTGELDANGQPISIPSVHSELNIKIHKGSDTTGPGIDAEVKWYQGVSGTGFFPSNLTKTPKWTGYQNRALGSGEKAIEAVKLAGMLSDTINTSAQSGDLFLGGYGMTGVCNDSVAVIEHAMSGRNLTYPLLMTDELLLPELQNRISQGGADGEAYARLLESIDILPNDAITNDTSRNRAFHSIPWQEGQEPFVSTSNARKALANN